MCISMADPYVVWLPFILRINFSAQIYPIRHLSIVQCAIYFDMLDVVAHNKSSYNVNNDVSPHDALSGL